MIGKKPSEAQNSNSLQYKKFSELTLKFYPTNHLSFSQKGIPSILSAVTSSLALLAVSVGCFPSRAFLYILCPTSVTVHN